MAWKIIRTPTFNRGYKNLSNELKERTNKAIMELVKAEDPSKLGEAKKEKLRGIYAYEIGKDYRLLYTVNWKERIISLLRVGTHKVYKLK